jgi:tetratricopeptide (TPR) repeat protein
VDNLAARPLAARPSGQLQVGEPVAAIGYSGGGGLNFTTGAVAQLHRFSGSMVVEATAPFTSGASGGPLLDSEGRLVGLLMFRAMNGTGHFFAVPVEWLAGVRSADRPDTPPFWQEAGPHLPYFMRANVLRGDSRWDELETLLAEWSRNEQDNPEPMYIRAQIDRQRGRLEAASRWYRQAIARDPDHALSWLGLTETMVRIAGADCARVAYARLSTLSPALSRQAADAHPELTGSLEATTCELL